MEESAIVQRSTGGFLCIGGGRPPQSHTRSEAHIVRPQPTHSPDWGPVAVSSVGSAARRDEGAAADPVHEEAGGPSELEAIVGGS